MASGGIGEKAAFADKATTAAAVIAAFFLVGWVTPQLPLGKASVWVSSGAFTLLIFVYAWLAGPGRRSGFPAFILAGLLIYPALFLWMIWLFSLSDGSPLLQLQHLEVGFTDQAVAHSLFFGGLIWAIAMTILIAAAVFLRDLIEVLRD